MKPHFCLLKMNIRCVCCLQMPSSADFCGDLGSDQFYIRVNMVMHVDTRNWTIKQRSPQTKTMIPQLFKINRNAEGRPWTQSVKRSCHPILSGFHGTGRLQVTMGFMFCQVLKPCWDENKFLRHTFPEWRKCQQVKSGVESPDVCTAQSWWSSLGASLTP